MHATTTALKSPPWLENAEGQPRRIGVEIEMSGLKLDALAAEVADFLGLDIRERGRYERVLYGDPAGDWVVELDYDLLKRLGRQERTDETLADELGRSAEEVLAWAAEALVPVELVGPPLPLQRLGEVEAWEAAVKVEETPLGKYVRVQRKAREKRRKLMEKVRLALIARTDNI